MCANSKDHEAWIKASQAGDIESAEAIAAGRMNAEQYEKVAAEKATPEKELVPA